MRLTPLDLTARAGHTWKTGDKANDERLASLRFGFAHRAHHWPEDQDVFETDWYPAMRDAIAEYDGRHLAYAEAIVALTKQPYPVPA